MATLQKIREKGPLVAFVIGFALLAFILGDLFMNSSALFGSSQMEVAEVKGESISIQEYQKKISNLEEIYKMNSRKSSLDPATMKSIRQQIWDQMIQEYVLADQFEELGIEVGDDELSAMVTGSGVDTDATLRQMFTNPETKAYDQEQASKFFREANNKENTRTLPFALFLESEMRRNKRYAKYTTLISKGLNVTDFEAKTAYKERVNMVDFQFTVKRYNKVADSTITADEARMKKYYDENKTSFKQKYTRSISYITFDVNPSKLDNKHAKEDITKLIVDFKKTDDNEQFIISNSDVANRIQKFKRDQLKEIGPDSIVFAADSGTVFGPYFQNGSYKIAKIVGGIETAPDTVGASHILIQPDGTIIKDMAAAQLIADSLKTLIDGGADFGILATTNSADKGSAAKAGDVGKFVEGAMVKPFNDACFQGKTDDIAVVESQFGIHIIKVTYQSSDVEKLSIAVVEEKLEPSKDTRQDAYALASKFAAENKTAEKYNATVESQGLTLKKANDLSPMSEIIAGLITPRDIVQWAFKDGVEVGNVSKVFTNGDKFVVGIVTEINEKGIPAFSAVKEDLAKIIIKEMKGDKFVAELKGADLNKAGEISGGKVNTAKNIGFSSSQFPGGGAEPQVIAIASKLAKDKVSDPIIGVNGVYVIKVISQTGVDADKIKETDYKSDFDNLSRQMSFRGNNDAYKALNKKANIIDSRAKFY